VGEVWTVNTTVPATVRTQGGEQPIADPGGDSSYTDKTCIVQFDLYSGLYLIPLPSGAVFKVKFHNEGMNGLSFLPVQTSVKRGGGLSGMRTPADGMVRFIRAGTDGLQYIGSVDPRTVATTGPGAWPYSTQPVPVQPQVTSTLPGTAGATEAFLVRLTGIREQAWYNLNGGVWLSESHSDGRTWEDPMQIDANARLVAGAQGPNGAQTYFVAEKDGHPVVFVCSAELDADGRPIMRKTQEIVAEGLPHLPVGLQWMTMQNGVLRLALDDGTGISYYQSFDGGRTWH